MIRCPKCGYPNLDSAKECVKTNCGTKFGISIPPAISSKPVQGTGIKKLHDTGSTLHAVRTLIDPGVFSLQTYDKEIGQIFALVRHSPFIQENDLYRQRAGETSLLFLEGGDEVNAFATDSPLHGIHETPPFVVVEGGLCNASKLAALALAASVEHGDRKHLLECIKWFGSSIKGEGNFSVEDAERGLGDLRIETVLTEEVQRKARSYFAAMILHVTAHELGHICLGHTLGRAVNLEVSRNQEREADSFASSVLCTTPYSDYNCYGSAVFWMVWTWVEEGNFPFLREPTTHPVSRERLIRLISDNASQFEATGITVNNIDEFLPKKS